MTTLSRRVSGTVWDMTGTKLIMLNNKETELRRRMTGKTCAIVAICHGGCALASGHSG